MDYNAPDDTYPQQRNRNTDSVFDFAVTSHGRTHAVTPHALAVNNVSHYNDRYENNHLHGASQRFAQQLDVKAIQEHNSLMDNGFNATSEITSLFLQSTKLAEEHNFNTIIGTYLTFAHKCNLPCRDISDSFKCSIICSLKLTDTTSICEAMQFKTAQDGQVRFERLVENVYGDFKEWEKILQVLSFEEDETKEYLTSSDSDFGNDLPTIKFVLDTLQQVGAESLSITDALKIYLLTNIKNVTSLVAINAFLTATMPATFNTSEACNIFTACMADSRFTQAQFS